jgi:hypothetical protein
MCTKVTQELSQRLLFPSVRLTVYNPLGFPHVALGLSGMLSPSIAFVRFTKRHWSGGKTHL